MHAIPESSRMQFIRRPKYSWRSRMSTWWKEAARNDNKAGDADASQPGQPEVAEVPSHPPSEARHREKREHGHHADEPDLHRPSICVPAFAPGELAAEHRHERLQIKLLIDAECDHPHAEHAPSHGELTASLPLSLGSTKGTEAQVRRDEVGDDGKPADEGRVADTGSPAAVGTLEERHANGQGEQATRHGCRRQDAEARSARQQRWSCSLGEGEKGVESSSRGTTPRLGVVPFPAAFARLTSS